MKTLTLLALLCLTSCNTVDLTLEIPEGMTAEDVPQIIIVQSWNYGSADATQAIADGVGEAVPGAVEAGVVDKP